MASIKSKNYNEDLKVNYFKCLAELSEIRIEKNLSYRDIVKKTELGMDTVYGIFNKNTVTSLNNFIKICRALDVNPANIIHRYYNE